MVYSNFTKDMAGFPGSHSLCDHSAEPPILPMFKSGARVFRGFELYARGLAHRFRVMKVPVLGLGSTRILAVHIKLISCSWNTLRDYSSCGLL